jgi:gas vesicle protein GvpO
MADTTATKKSPAKKTTAKKSPAKKAPAKKTTAKKTSAEAAPAKKTSSRTRRPAAKATAEPAPARKSSERRPGGGTQMAGAAIDVVRQLTGKVPESVTGLQRSEDGWRVAVDVLELERIPSTTDVLATYEVTLDEQGELQGCSRVHRYLRGSPGDE